MFLTLPNLGLVISEASTGNFVVVASIELTSLSARLLGAKWFSWELLDFLSPAIRTLHLQQSFERHGILVLAVSDDVILADTDDVNNWFHHLLLLCL